MQSKVKITFTECEAIGTRTREGSIRYESHTAVAAMATRGFFREAASRGLKDLPVAQMWIMDDGERADTLMRRFEYGRFAGNGGAMLTRPTAVITGLRGRDPIDVQRVQGYSAYGRPVINRNYAEQIEAMYV